MAWPAVSFTPGRMFNDFAGDLFALRRAVHQRKAAMGYSVGSAPALEDSVGLDIFGATLRAQLQGVRDDIHDMVTDPQTEAYFVTADEGDTAVDMAWLESQTGLDDPGDPTVSGEDGVNILNADHWEFCRAALDLLVYAKVELGMFSDAVSLSASQREHIDVALSFTTGVGWEPTPDEVWADCADDTPDTVTDESELRWLLDWTGSPTGTDVKIVDYLQITLDTGKFDGVASSGTLVVWVTQGTITIVTTVLLSMPGGNSFTIPTDYESGQTGAVLNMAVAPVIAANQVMTFTFGDPPSACPWDDSTPGTGIFTNAGWIRATPMTYTFYLDLSTVLTDQT